MTDHSYEIIVTPLPDDEGGGYLAMAPDLMGCMSDGQTPSEALSELLDAISVWAEAQRAKGFEMPEPGWRYREAADRHEELMQVLEDQRKRIEELEAEIRQLSSVESEPASFSSGRFILRTDLVTGRVWSNPTRKEGELVTFRRTQ